MRCKFCGVANGKLVDYIYYDTPEDMSILFPVLEFAYNKHTLGVLNLMKINLTSY